MFVIGNVMFFFRMERFRIIIFSVLWGFVWGGLEEVLVGGGVFESVLVCLFSLVN